MRVAVYAGSFDPVTNGHLAILSKALPLFDEVHVLVAVNPAKTPWFSAAQRRALIEASVPLGVVVAATEGYVVDYARSVGAQWLLRGVRDGADATAELGLAALNAQLAPELSTMFITATAATFDLSSSKLKSLVARGERVDALCPPAVAAALTLRSRSVEGDAHEPDASLVLP